MKGTLEYKGGQWCCPLCGATCPKHFRHNCPKSPEGRAGKLIAITQAVTSKRERDVNWEMYFARPAVDLAKYIEICLDCGDHNGNTCTRRGMDPEKPCQWLMKLGCVGFRECPNWK